MRSRRQVSANLSTIKTVARAALSTPVSDEVERAIGDLCHMLWEVVNTTPKFAVPGFSYTLASHTLVVLYTLRLGLPALGLEFVPRVADLELRPRRELYSANVHHHRKSFSSKNVTRCSRIIREALVSAEDHEPTKQKLTAFQDEIKRAADILRGASAS